MRHRDRELARKRLDFEMRSFRRAGTAIHPGNGLLRAVRQALRVPVAEIAAKMGVARSVIFDLEANERKTTIQMSSISRMAQAMGCKVVYGIVPAEGQTMDELYERRLWANVLGRDRD